EMRKTAPDIADRLSAIRSHVERMSRIVQDVRDFSRPSTGRRTRVALNELVEKALHIFRMHEKSRGLRVEVASQNGPVTLDAVEDQIVQVLLNLLLNGADACGATGVIRIQLSGGRDEAAIAVIDHGTGMSERVRQHLFVPFFTTKEPGKGVGLGLFISDAIVRGHGGRIEVDSSPGVGSTFTVHLPRTAEDGTMK